MKYLLVAAAAAIATGGLFALRSGPAVVREKRIEVPVRVEVPVETPVAPPANRSTNTQVAVPTANPAEKRAEDSTSAPLGPQEKMLFLFEREIDLAPGQRAHFVQVLRERAVEIEDVYRRIAETKHFSRRGYSATIRAIRARSYERMAEVLDSAQNQRFRQLVAQGRLGDAVAIELQPDWTVTD